MEIERERQSDHVPKEGGSWLECGEDMEGDWNTLKTCLLKNVEVVCGVTKGPSKRMIPWWWNDEVGKAVKEKGISHDF